jgi:hypothetical protein
MNRHRKSNIQTRLTAALDVEKDKESSMWIDRGFEHAFSCLWAQANEAGESARPELRAFVMQAWTSFGRDPMLLTRGGK